MRAITSALLLPLALLLLLSLQLNDTRAVSDQPSLYALDGLGRPVAWWVVLKLPMLVQDDSESSVRPTPCDCPPPDCSNVAHARERNHSVRATGLCYLYADARTPALHHFRELGFDCLGQGGNDPVSHTLRQRETRPDAYWALFNDQLNGIARPFEDGPYSPSQAKNATTCGGGDVFSAHAKGTVAMDASLGGGFYLQTSTPNFPDPSRTRGSLNNSGSERDAADTFVRLGCQRDNNVKFAQHFAAFSLEEPAMETLARALSVARLCSGNFYRGELSHALASDALWRDGAAPDASKVVAALYHALLDPNSTDGGGYHHNVDPADDLARRVTLPLRQPPAASLGDSNVSTSVFAPLSRSDYFLPDINSRQTEYDTAASVTVDGQGSNQDATSDPGGRSQAMHGRHAVEVEVLVKGPRATVPPWALLAASIESDVSVASWWDDGYGIPTICAGDAFASTPHQFCLENPRAGATLLPPDGRARFNVENLIQATWSMRDGSDNLTWHLVGGGRARDGNHAKWGVATPRNGHPLRDEDDAIVTLADLNMEGFPCSKVCNGSQAGRGGSFFSLRQSELHRSLTQSLITKACRCVPPPIPESDPTSLHGEQDPDVAAFETLRMCHHGCIKKFEERWQGADLPKLSVNASSYWSD